MDLSARHKKLIYQSQHRGTKEMDLLLGSFAAHYVPSFADADLDEFEQFLNMPDIDLYNWRIGLAVPPANLQGNVMRLWLGYQHHLGDKVNA